jgi:hypothetical protein
MTVISWEEPLLIFHFAAPVFLKSFFLPGPTAMILRTASSSSAWGAGQTRKQNRGGDISNYPLPSGKSSSACKQKKYVRMRDALLRDSQRM